jgi:WHEP-TRS domain/OB-fold nucleic acid binding domain
MAVSLRASRAFLRPLSRARCLASPSLSGTRHAVASNRPLLSTRLHSTTSSDLTDLQDRIQKKGDEIRQLKADGIDKAALAPHVDELKALKAQLAAESVETNAISADNTPARAPVKSAPANPPVELSDSELRQTRWAKAEAMKQAGINPFAYSFVANKTAAQLASEYESKLENGQEDADVSVSVAGRIMLRRVFGKLAFFTLQDQSGSIQLQFDKSRLQDGFQVSIQIYAYKHACMRVCVYMFAFVRRLWTCCCFECVGAYYRRCR